MTRREVRNFRMRSSSSAKVKVKKKKRRRAKVDTRLKINNHFPRGATLSSPLVSDPESFARLNAFTITDNGKKI